MMIIISILVAIIMFSFIVLAHEYGHYKTAKLFGVKVEEFGLGIPPRAKKLWRDKDGTLYTLNWLPIGGFVKLYGEQMLTFALYDREGKILNNEQIEKYIKESTPIYDKDNNLISKEYREEIRKKIEENNSSVSLVNKPVYAQAIVILAGVIMNFLLAWIIFSILFFVGVKPIGINTKIDTDLDIRLIPTLEKSIQYGVFTSSPGVYISPLTGSIAQQSGLRDMDLIKSLNDTKITDYKHFKDVLSVYKSKQISLKVERTLSGISDPEIIDIKLTTSSDGKIGAYLIPNLKPNESFEYKYAFGDSIKYGALETYNQSILTFKALGILAKKIFNPKDQTERKQAINSMSGPIGLVDFLSKTLANGIVFVVIIGALVSINLGVFNLLPIPALDGGRCLLIIINSSIKKIFGKKALNDNLENFLHLAFFILLIIISVFIAYNDIIKIINN